MLEIQIKASGRHVAPRDLAALLGPERAYEEIGDMIEALIAQMDLLTGDCDIEDDDPAEDDDPSGQCDEDDVNTAWERVDWQAKGAGCVISDDDHQYLGRDKHGWNRSLEAIR